MARLHVITDASGTTTVPFTAAEEAAQDALDAANAAETTRQASFTSDASRADIVNKLHNASAPQIRQFVANNVTDLASAKTMLANILILVALDARN